MLSPDESTPDDATTRLEELAFGVCARRQGTELSARTTVHVAMV
jgi:hypothetical protein